MATQGLQCYAARYPDLLATGCGGDLNRCNWEWLRQHQQATAATEHRIKACRAWDVTCYAIRYPDLKQGYCEAGGYAADSSLVCDWLGLLRHWSSVGRGQGLLLNCETPELTCYAVNHPDLSESFCASDSNETDPVIVHES